MGLSLYIKSSLHIAPPWSYNQSQVCGRLYTFEGSLPLIFVVPNPGSETHPKTPFSQGRRWADVGPDFEQMWGMTLRAMDDIKESVRRAAAGLVRSMRGLTLRMCDPEQTNAADAAACTAVALPFLIQKGTHQSPPLAFPRGEKNLGQLNILPAFLFQKSPIAETTPLMFLYLSRIPVNRTFNIFRLRFASVCAECAIHNHTLGTDPIVQFCMVLE